MSRAGSSAAWRIPTVSWRGQRQLQLQAAPQAPLQHPAPPHTTWPHQGDSSSPNALPGQIPTPAAPQPLPRLVRLEIVVQRELQLAQVLRLLLLLFTFPLRQPRLRVVVVLGVLQRQPRCPVQLGGPSPASPSPHWHLQHPDPRASQGDGDRKHRQGNPGGTSSAQGWSWWDGGMRGWGLPGALRLGAGSSRRRLRANHPTDGCGDPLPPAHAWEHYRVLAGPFLGILMLIREREGLVLLHLRQTQPSPLLLHTIAHRVAAPAPQHPSAVPAAPQSHPGRSQCRRQARGGTYHGGRPRTQREHGVRAAQREDGESTRREESDVTDSIAEGPRPRQGTGVLYGPIEPLGTPTLP